MAGDRPVLNVAGSRVAVRVLTGSQTINQATPGFIQADLNGSVSTPTTSLTGAQAVLTSSLPPYASTVQVSFFRYVP